MMRFLWLAAVLVLVPGIVDRLQAADRPNILFLLADDQCFRTLRAAGNDEIQTPALDRLMARGT
ncbi:MAG: arylsulfatase, partial [Planctomycetaceae bacterium]